MIIASKTAAERGTYVIDVAFYDENGAAVTPTAASWTLTDAAGTVLNGRSAVAISPLGTTATIVLSGADLAIGAYGTDRRVLVQATYTSSLGAGLPASEEFLFRIDPRVGVS